MFVSSLHALVALSPLVALTAQAGHADFRKLPHLHKRLNKVSRTVARSVNNNAAAQQDWSHPEYGYAPNNQGWQPSSSPATDAAAATATAASTQQWDQQADLQVSASLGISVGSGSSSSSSSTSQYQLATNFTGDALYSDDNWSFYSDSDPTHGTVNYLDSQSARDAGLVYTNDQGQFVLKVDNSSWVDSSRNSVRISSKTTIEQGQLLLFDAAHAPTGCSTWPAFWLLGSEGEWPYSGEVDIIELYNKVGNNQYTLHTTGGDISGETGFNGTFGDVTSCDSTNGGQGCGILDVESTGGAGLNSGGGGVWATLWNDDGWSMWFFHRDAIPQDIQSNSPNPDSWGTPAAYFSADRVPASMFKKLQMILNTTICGDWAGGVLPDADQGCPQSCSAYVQDPSNFDQAYWEVNYIKIFDGPSSSSSSSISVGATASAGW